MVCRPFLPISGHNLCVDGVDYLECLSVECATKYLVQFSCCGLRTDPLSSYFVMMRVQFLIFVFFLSQIVSSASNLASWRNIITDAAKDEALAPNLVVRNLAILCIGAYECLNREDNQKNNIFKPPR